jgi:hypothetical protein
VQLCCAWAKATSDAATRTTRAVRDTDVEVPLLRPEVPRVGRTLLSESCVLCVCVCVCVCTSACVRGWVRPQPTDPCCISRRPGHEQAAHAGAHGGISARHRPCRADECACLGRLAGRRTLRRGPSSRVLLPAATTPKRSRFEEPTHACQVAPRCRMP